MRTTAASTTTSSSSSSSPSSNSSTTTTPMALLAAPYRSSSSCSTIPFSWEEQPGVPKPVGCKSPNHPSTVLPLPPPLRPKSTPRKKRPDHAAPGFVADPFAAALVACSKPDPSTHRPSEPTLVRRSAKDRFGLALGFRLAWDPLGSCRSNHAVATSTAYARRSGQQMIAYNLLHRRRA